MWGHFQPSMQRQTCTVGPRFNSFWSESVSLYYQPDFSINLGRFDSIIISAQYRPSVRLASYCFSDIIIIGSGNVLSPDLCQAIIWTKDWKLLIWLLGTNCNEILIANYTISFKEMYLNVPCAQMAAILSPSQCIKPPRHQTNLLPVCVKCWPSIWAFNHNEMLVQLLTNV